MTDISAIGTDQLKVLTELSELGDRANEVLPGIRAKIARLEKEAETAIQDVRDIVEVMRRVANGASEFPDEQTFGVQPAKKRLETLRRDKARGYSSYQVS